MHIHKTSGMCRLKLINISINFRIHCMASSLHMWLVEQKMAVLQKSDSPENILCKKYACLIKIMHILIALVPEEVGHTSSVYDIKLHNKTLF